MLNQKERQPLPGRRAGRLDLRRHRRLSGPDQDRAGRRVPRQPAVQRSTPDSEDLLDRINETGELSDEDEEALGKAIARAIDDFGPDFDKEGNPLEEGESERIRDEEERQKPRHREDGDVERPRPRPRPSRRRPAPPRSRHPWPPEGSQEPDLLRQEHAKITRAMEMVAAARLRRAEQRIDALRPYARRVRKMTRQVAEAAGAEARNLPVLQEREEDEQCRRPPGHRRSRPRRRVQHPDHPGGVRLQRELRRRRHRRRLLRGRAPRRLDDAIPRRGAVMASTWASPIARRSPTPARSPRSLIAAYIDRRARPGRPGLQPLRLAADPVRPAADAAAAPAGRGLRGGGQDEADETEEGDADLVEAHRKALWDLRAGARGAPRRAVRGVRAAVRLPGAARVDRFRARRADDRDAERGRERQGDDPDLTLEMNRVRQAEITQEILEVVARRRGLS